MWIFVDANLEVFWRYTDLGFNSPLVFERYHCFFAKWGRLKFSLTFSGRNLVATNKNMFFCFKRILAGKRTAAPFFFVDGRPWKTGFFSTTFAWTTEIAMLTWSDFHQTVERWVDFTTETVDSAPESGVSAPGDGTTTSAKTDELWG